MLLWWHKEPDVTEIGSEFTERTRTMADIAALQADCVDAETAKTKLVGERRSKRDSMSKIKFRAYNAETAEEQRLVEADVTAANKAFQAALNEVRSDAVAQVVNVGTLNEGNQIGPVS